MKLIEPPIRSVEIVPQPNGSYFVGLVVSNDAHASMLYDSLQGLIKLSYNYFEQSTVLMLNIRNVNYDEEIRVNLPVDENTKALMKAIDDKAIMYVYSAFPDERHHANLFGQYIPVVV